MPEVISRTQWKKPDISLQDTKHFNHAVNRVVKKYSAWIAIEMLRVFTATAARFTPPNMGKANIEQKYYNRPVQDLVKLSKGEYAPYHATKADYAALRQGFKFRVLNTKVGHKRNEVYAYCKGINEAKRVSRIQNRGLARYTWGDALNNHSEEVMQLQHQTGGKIVETDLPPIFNRLVKKSPNITKYHFGYSTATWSRGVNAYYDIHVTNKLAEVERYCRIAVERGTVEVNKWTNKFFTKVKAGLENDIKKLLQNTHIYAVKFK